MCARKCVVTGASNEHAPDRDVAGPCALPEKLAPYMGEALFYLLNKRWQKRI
jgi:hypothetical protein